MKRLIMFVLALAFMAAPVYSQGQWIQSDSTHSTWKAFFLDTLNGYVVGNGKIILHTNDGGRSVIQQQAPVNISASWFEGLYFRNLQEGWVVGSSGYSNGSGVTLHTTNSGTTWQQQFDSATNSNWGDITEVGNTLWKVGGVVASSYGIGLVGKSTNNGQTWQITQLSQFCFISGLVALDTQHVVIYGNAGTLAFTTDGGNTWQSAGIDTTMFIYKVRFANKLVGYATGSKFPKVGTYLYKTTDGGATWQVIYTRPDAAQMMALAVLGDTLYLGGYINNGTPALTKSTDGGTTWQVELITRYAPRDIVMLDSKHGWMVTDQGFYYYQYQPPNAPPVVQAVADTTVWADSAFAIQLVSSDPEGDTLSFTAKQKPAWLSLSSQTGLLSGTPTVADTGTSAVWIQVTDSVNFVDVKFNLRVIAPQVNRAPQFTCVIHDSVAYIDSLYSVNLTATDPDNDSLHYSLVQAPSFLRVDSLTGRIWGRPKAGDSGRYTVRSVVSDGRGGFDTLTFNLKVDRLTGVEQIENNVPTEFHLSQNYPNPFNPTTMISYQLPATSYVRLTVYDMLGREVAELVSGRQSAGTYRASFNGANLPSGMYICRLQTGDNVATKKMLLLK